MKLGLNLSFATKRWLDPYQLAAMCRNDFKVEQIQFTWDLIDPWWPVIQRNALAGEYRRAFEAEGLLLDATFGGIASYTYAQLLAPSELQREVSYQFFQRAIDLTVEMGVEVMGTPVGGMTYDHSRNAKMREERYVNMLEYLFRIAEYGKDKGLKEIHIEATPLITEFPHSPEASVQMMEDLASSAIPYKLLVDWGHALFSPLLGQEADMGHWLKACKPYIGSIHLQQTDGLLDRHWDFTKEGIVTPQLIKKATEDADLSDIVQYLEVVPAFEAFDDEVYEGMKKTMDYQHRELVC